MLMPLIAHPTRADLIFSRVRAFQMNIEIKTVKTYLTKPYPNGITVSSRVSFRIEQFHCIAARNAFQKHFKRCAWATISTAYIDYDANPQELQFGQYLTLETRTQVGRQGKNKRGELVEPAKPIIIYIDPNTPRKWIPYLIQGINDWQTAYEKAGFKNAIMGKEVPANDTTWSLEDARHSFVVYKPSNISNATGPSIIDPPAAERCQTHINWYHNTMDLLYKWYFIQAGAVDPRQQAPLQRFPHGTAHSLCFLP